MQQQQPKGAWGNTSESIRKVTKETLNRSSSAPPINLLINSDVNGNVKKISSHLCVFFFYRAFICIVTFF